MLKWNKISSKVFSTAVSGALVTVVVGFLSASPATKDNKQFDFLRDPAVCAAALTVIGAIAGYSTTETAHTPSGDAEK